MAVMKFRDFLGLPRSISYTMYIYSTEHLFFSMCHRLVSKEMEKIVWRASLGKVNSGFLQLQIC
jgi:hypothetical protein